MVGHEEASPRSGDVNPPENGAEMKHHQGWEKRWARAMGGNTARKRTNRFWRKVHSDPKRRVLYLLPREGSSDSQAVERIMEAYGAPDMEAIVREVVNRLERERDAAREELSKLAKAITSIRAGWERKKPVV